MPYRAPRFSYIHAARDVGAAAITLDGDTEDADFPTDNIVDDRANTLFKFSASFTTPNIIVDLGAAFITGISRCIVPPNHNYTSIRIQDDDNLAMTTPATLHSTFAATPGQQVDIEFAVGNSTQRYIRLRSLTTDLFFLPQIHFTKIMTLTVGPELVGTPDGFRENFTRIGQNTGQSPTVQHGPAQRILEYNYPAGLTGTDLTNMEAFIADVGMDQPFYVDPHSFSATPAVDDPPILMKFAEKPIPEIFVGVASTGVERKTFNLKLIESVD